MIKFVNLKRYKLLSELKKKFLNPQKEVIDGHIFLKIDDKQYHKVIEDNYNDYMDMLRKLHKLLNKDFYFQKYPNFRYNTKEDNYPVWHSDIHFNHNKEQINVMVPITKKDFGFEIITFGSFILNKLPFNFLNNKIIKKFLSLISKKINYLDKILLFNGAYLHTASCRKGFKKPRLSIDFRLLPTNFKGKVKLSKRNIPLKPGYYFSEKPISQY